MSHDFYIALSYAVTAVVCLGLILWVITDARARKRELSALEAAGIRRRSSDTTQIDKK